MELGRCGGPMTRGYRSGKVEAPPNHHCLPSADFPSRRQRAIRRIGPRNSTYGIKASVIATMNSRDGRHYGLKDETKAKQLARTLQQIMPRDREPRPKTRK